MIPEMARARLQTGKPAVAIVVPLLLCSLAFLADGRHESSLAQGHAHFPLQLTSSSFADGGGIPQRYTCDGANLSPNLRWSTVPGRTKSLALVVHDPDAPVDFTHWLAYNIPPSTRELAEGASPRVAMPKGSDEGTNDFSGVGYGGPCPPPGKPHHYIFTLYALDVRLMLAGAPKRGELESAIRPHVIAEGRVTGTYQR